LGNYTKALRFLQARMKTRHKTPLLNSDVKSDASKLIGNANPIQPTVHLGKRLT